MVLATYRPGKPEIIWARLHSCTACELFPGVTERYSIVLSLEEAGAHHVYIDSGRTYCLVMTTVSLPAEAYNALMTCCLCCNVSATGLMDGTCTQTKTVLNLTS